jgi:hypothetical protein
VDSEIVEEGHETLHDIELDAADPTQVRTPAGR